MFLHNRIVKVTAVVFTLIFGFLMIYFVTFEAGHIVHECSGESCPVCQEIHMAESMVKQFGTALALMTAVFFHVVFYKTINATVDALIPERNLILDKVRENR